MERYVPLAIAWIVALAVLSVPVYLRARRPQAYRGIWRGLGEAVPLSAAHLTAFVIALPLALGLLAAADSLTDGAYRRDPLVLAATTAAAALVLGAAVLLVARRLGTTRRRRP